MAKNGRANVCVLFVHTKYKCVVDNKWAIHNWQQIDRCHGCKSSHSKKWEQRRLKSKKSETFSFLEWNMTTAYVCFYDFCFCFRVKVKENACCLISGRSMLPYHNITLSYLWFMLSTDSMNLILKLSSGDSHKWSATVDWICSSFPLTFTVTGTPVLYSFHLSLVLTNLDFIQISYLIAFNNSFQSCNYVIWKLKICFRLSYVLLRLYYNLSSNKSWKQSTFFLLSSLTLLSSSSSSVLLLLLPLLLLLLLSWLSSFSFFHIEINNMKNENEKQIMSDRRKKGLKQIQAIEEYEMRSRCCQILWYKNKKKC